jgi:CRISPR-associated protein Csm4
MVMERATLASYILLPRSPMHFGERGVGLEETSIVCHADTLFGALCMALAENEGTSRLEAMLELFRTWQPPFLLSSLYPFALGVRFLPRPMLGWPGKPPGEEAGAAGSSKQLKKLRLVSWELFRWWTAGGVPPVPEVVPAQGEQVWLTKDECRRLPPTAAGISWWKVEEAPRVSLDRVTLRSNVYHSGALRFAPGCGLHCLVWWRDETWRPSVERALRALGDAGIGGERSGGYGQFHLEVQPLPEPELPPAGGGVVALSPYLPHAEELAAGVLGEGAAWDLIPRSGWLAAPGVALRHRPVTMLAEGSVLRAPFDEARALGRLVEVTPGPYTAHPVYRYGYAWCWPATLPAAGGD